ncbi:MAG: succinyl-diaminopimelate desuccinylase [Actinobacteria bacterium RBG_16_68_21]|nr:MAG: succinyl-diaminopimelate desuccinylase [Actinobacteria bacterium RBG_16_68_21]
MSLVDDLVWLVDIPSPTGAEEAIRDAIAARLSHLEPRTIGNSVVVGRRTGKPLIAVYGHLDTVPSQGNLPGRVADGRAFGLGASDMKGGLAVMIALLEDPDVAAGTFDVLGVFYDGEEGPAEGNGLEAVLDRSPDLLEAELSIVMEPTDGELQLGCQGVINATVEFHGEAAHSARPWLGENAVTKAGAWLAEMHGRGWRDVDVAGLTFKETFVVTTAAGGVARNVIPARFALNLNHRFPPDRTLDEAEAMVREMCAPADLVEIVDRAPAAPIPEGNPHLERLRGLVGVVSAKTAWTDVARLTGRGLAAVNFGPGEVAQAHRADESAPIEGMERALGVMRGFLS